MKGIGDGKSPQHQDELLLFDDASPPETLQTRIIHKVIGKTCQTTQDLAKHLPTGTVLVFQLMSPIVTREGNCDKVSLYLTAMLVAVCGLSCFLLCFTDSFRDKNGVVCYGIVTFHGIRLIDTMADIPPKFAEKYRLRLIDFVHGFMSVLVFAVVVLFDKNMVQCFCPTPTDQIQKLLTALPIMISGICATLFAVFPTKRHGIGFPLSAN
ncbi:Protein DMP4 [Linum grandiflorum]